MCLQKGEIEKKNDIVDIQNEFRKRINSYMSHAVQFFEHSDLLDLLNIMIILFDHHTGEIIKANKMFCEYLGYTKEEIKGMNIFDFIPEDEREQNRKALKEYSQGLEPCKHLYRNNYTHKNGTIKPMFWVRSDINKQPLMGYSFACALDNIEIYEN